MERDEIRRFVGETVVIDTRTPIIYIGRLSEVEGNFLVLEDVDVHDVGDSNTTKEIYILESKKYGVKKNRTRVHVSFEQVVSISNLDDVIAY